MGWLDLLIPALTGVGGVVAGLSAHRLGLSKEKRADFQLFADKINEDNDRLRSELGALKQEMEVLRQENIRHEAQILMLESTHLDHPYPKWIKSIDGTMISLNKAYEVTFLRPLGFIREDYEGFKDDKIYPLEVAKAFREHDLEVIKTGEPWEGTEFVPDGKGNMIEWRILKYPRFHARKVIGIAGEAIPVLKKVA
jgi:hypothetical protein